MSAQPGSDLQLDRTIDAWLELGPTELSDRVVERARAEVHRTPQRRTWRRAWTAPTTTRRPLRATVAVAVIVVVMIGVGVRMVSTQVVGTLPSPSPTSMAPSPGVSSAPSSFHSTGSMTMGRVGHSATLLLDGRVLIAGGSSDVGDDRRGVEASTLTASAELYDPATGIFTPTGSMSTARAHHTATLLTDGRVLVAGGGNSGWERGGYALASAELYDPVSGTFSPTGSMGTARLFAAATRLADGEVLVAGGETPIPGDLASAHDSAELYDPASGTFSPTGSMAGQRAVQRASDSPTGTLLADGRALLAGGGFLADGTYQPSIQLYDPATRSFSAAGPLAPMAGEIVDISAGLTALADGRVLILGGLGDPAHPSEFAQTYEPTTRVFSVTGKPAIGAWGARTTVMLDGRVLLVGGVDYHSQGETDQAQIFDPATDAFTLTSVGFRLDCAQDGCGALRTARTGHTATLLPDGRVLIAGGGSNAGHTRAFSSAEIFQ